MHEDFQVETNLHERPHALHAVFLALALGYILFLLGCSTKGSSSSDSSEFKVGVVPIKIIAEGAATQNGIYAFVRGSGASGFALMDPQKRLLKNSTFSSVAQEYRCVIADQGLQNGEYTLSYSSGGETKEYKALIQWTSIVNFKSSPSKFFDPSRNELTVDYSSISGNYKYNVELYEIAPFLGTLLAQTTPTFYSSRIQTYVRGGGGYKAVVILIASNYSSDQLVSQTWYQFADPLML